MWLYSAPRAVPPADLSLTLFNREKREEGRGKKGEGEGEGEGEERGKTSSVRYVFLFCNVDLLASR